MSTVLCLCSPAGAFLALPERRYGLRAAQRSRLAAPLQPAEARRATARDGLKNNRQVQGRAAASCYSVLLGRGDATVVAGCGAAMRTGERGADARAARHGGYIPRPGAVNGAAARARSLGADARAARHGGVFRIVMRQRRCGAGAFSGRRRARCAPRWAYSACCCGTWRCGRDSA